MKRCLTFETFAPCYRYSTRSNIQTFKHSNIQTFKHSNIQTGETKVELSSADYPQLTVYATVRKDQEIKVGDKVGEVSLKKDIRNFGKKYDSWLTKAMEGQGQKKTMKEKKWRHKPSRLSIYLFCFFHCVHSVLARMC